MKSRKTRKSVKQNKYFKIVALVLPLIAFSLVIIFIINNRQTIEQQAATVQTSYTPAGMRAVPDPLYGVTVDDVSNVSGIVASLSHLSHKPTTRIVFDGGQQPSAYATAITQIQPVSYILGMLADSTAISTYSTAAYSQRVTDYLNAFGNQVDIWEVGNEVNGEWLGSDVPAKILNAYTLVKQAGKRTELTLYYNGLDDTKNCYSNKNNLMFRWAQSNIPAAMKQGLDYVLISYYEQDCPNVSKDWVSVFTQLHTMFPNSRIGFGENGTTKATDATTLKTQYIDEYYPAWVNVPCYVAGHFWWYFYEDGVPYLNNSLWTKLNTDMNALSVPTSHCGSSPTDTVTPTISPTITLSPSAPVPSNMYCLGGCIPVSASPQPTNTVTVEPSQVTLSPSPSLPVPSGTPQRIRSSNFLQLLLQFILQFFQLLLKLF